MTPRHVKAFLKDDKIIYEINEHEKPVDYRWDEKQIHFEKRVAIWQSQHKYIEGSEEQQTELKSMLLGKVLIEHGKTLDDHLKQGILIDPSLIEERNGFIYLKESKGQDEKRYTKKELKRIFNAGKNCMQDHPDDDTYDEIRFEKILKMINDLKKSNATIHSNKTGNN